MAPGGNPVFAYGAAIYRSTDGGSHWAKVLTLAGQRVTQMAAGTAGAAYAASDNGLYVSHDGGVRWKMVGSVGNQPVVGVAASGSAAYAAAAIGLFKTANDGRSWTMLDTAPPGIQFIGVSPSDPSEVFGERSGHSFAVSRDGGSTWQTANSGIRDTNFTASTIQVAPSTPQVVYTGSWGIHFYASRDGGRHWVRTATISE
jgi:photosystem II stability/assembly factor-like uncharacterized protein